MSSKKLTPRQRMINMMYIVLTALLAMNVSREVLNAFKIVDKGIVNSNTIIQQRNAEYYSAFTELKAKDQTEKMIKLYALSNQTKEKTSDLLDYISSLQQNLKDESGIILSPEGEQEFKRPDDVNTATRLLTQNKLGKVEGEELRLKLDSARMDFLSIIDEGNMTLKNSEAYTDYKTMYASLLPLEFQPAEIEGLGKEKKAWADFNFGNVPVIASDVILEKLKNDVINTETQVLEYLLQQAQGDIINFDVLEAKVIAPKSYLASGKKYEADIFISAASSSTQMDVFIGEVDKDRFDGKSKLFVENEELPFIETYEQIPVNNGKATFEEIANGVGNKNYEGIVRVKKPTGGYELYPFFADYEVAPPSGLSVSPTMMNVLYIGVDNPISIAVNGAKSDADVKANISQGNIVKNGNGQYVARVNTQGTATINVQANVNDQLESFPPMEFRVLRIPDPDISLCGFAKKKRMAKSEILACNGLIAQNEEFVFKAPFQVVSYEVIINSKTNGVKSKTNIGAVFNPDAQNMLNNIQSGEAVIFDEIVVRDPANNNRKINGSIYIEVM